MRGFVLPSLLITAVFLTSLAAIIAGLAVNSYNLAKQDVYGLNAQLATDAGLEAGIVEINTDNSWAGSGSEIEYYNDGTTRLTYETTVVDGSDASEKSIVSTGRAYSPVDATDPNNERTYTVNLRGLQTGGTYSLVTGVGGLEMNNSAKIVAGDVYVNGEIEMTNTATIGLASNPVTVKAAHAACPDGGGSGYPRVCNPGENGEPISLKNSAHIYGEVRATNQTDGDGMSDPGLIPGQTIDPLDLPEHDREAQKTAATNTMSGSSASCSGKSTRNWPANLHITGDVTLSNSCEVTINGDVWIDGKFKMSNSTELIVPDSINLGDTVDGNIPTIMVDGDEFEMSNSSTIIANSSDIGVQAITYWSEAGCSPDCSDVTGSDLYDSQTNTTIKLSNSADAPESILYARWSQVEIANGGDIGAVIGQTVKMTNSATITFGVAAGGGSSGYIYVIDSYQRSF